MLLPMNINKYAVSTLKCSAYFFLKTQSLKCLLTKLLECTVGVSLSRVLVEGDLNFKYRVGMFINLESTTVYCRTDFGGRNFVACSLISSWGDSISDKLL
jgi:hypothetical protein